MRDSEGQRRSKSNTEDSLLRDKHSRHVRLYGMHQTAGKGVEREEVSL